MKVKLNAVSFSPYTTAHPVNSNMYYYTNNRYQIHYTFYNVTYHPSQIAYKSCTDK